VHLHGGTIDASMREGGGLRIQIILPIDCTDPVPDTDTFFQRLVDHERRWKDREA
jgi:hypothetical protein